MKGQLPPLPGSDKKTLYRNATDSFYQKRPGDIWGKAQIAHTEIDDKKKPCEHYFEKVADSIECSNCNVGWEKVPPDITAKDGKVFYKTKQIVF